MSIAPVQVVSTTAPVRCVILQQDCYGPLIGMHPREG